MTLTLGNGSHFEGKKIALFHINFDFSIMGTLPSSRAAVRCRTYPVIANDKSLVALLHLYNALLYAE